MTASLINLTSRSFDGKNCADYRHYWTGRFVSYGAAPGKRLRGPRSRPANEQPPALAHRAFAQRRKRLRQIALSPLQRSVGRHHPAPDFFRGSTGRDLSSRWAKPRWAELRDSGIDLRRDRDGHAPPARDRPRPAATGEVLSRFQFRDFRERHRIAPNRDDATPAGESLRLRESVRDPARAGLPRVIRRLCLQWHSL